MFVQKVKSDFKEGFFFGLSAQLFEKSETLIKIFASYQSEILIMEH